MLKLRTSISIFFTMLARRFVRFCLAALAVVATQVTFAAVVFNNGAPDQLSGTQMSESVVAEDFTLTAASTVGSFRFWSVQSDPLDYLGSVYWAVFTDAAGSPGAILFGGTTVAAVAAPTGASTGFGYAEYVFNIDVVDFALAAGNYWLGLHNGPLTATNPTEMLWETTASTIGSESKYFDSVFGWVGAGTNLAFVLNGPGAVDPPPGVPEPGTLALIGLALVAARVARRKA